MLKSPPFARLFVTLLLALPFAACGGSSGSDGGGNGKDAKTDGGANRDATMGGGGDAAAGLDAMGNEDAATGVDAEMTGMDAEMNADATMMGGDATPGEDATMMGGDATPGEDATMMGGDAGSEDTGVPDSGPVTCSAASIINLNTAGTRTGTSVTTSYTGSNANTPAMGILPSPSCETLGFAGHEVFFSYTPRASGRVLVSTDHPETTFDTVLWALSQCAWPATELACNDDAAAGDYQSTFTATTTANQGITIVVAGYGNTIATTTTGTFRLTVTEQTPVAIGGVCDPTGVSNYCTGDARCVTPPQGGASTCQVLNYTETVVLNPIFIDACAVGTRVPDAMLDPHGTFPARDDGHTHTALTIPFAFTFYGAPQTHIWPSTNGYAIFDAVTPPVDSTGGILPTAAETSPAVFPFWQDLILRPTPTSDLCYATSGAAPNRRFVVEWLNAHAYAEITPDTTHLTFEVILNETANTLDFVYNTLTAPVGDETAVNGSQAAIGIQSQDGTFFTAHTGTVAVGRGLHYAP
jgi:hypothetical protein